MWLVSGAALSKRHPAAGAHHKRTPGSELLWRDEVGHALAYEGGKPVDVGNRLGRAREPQGGTASHRFKDLIGSGQRVVPELR